MKKTKSSKQASAKKAQKSKPAGEPKTKSAKTLTKPGKAKKTSKAQFADDEDEFGDFTGEENIKLDELSHGLDDEDEDEFFVGDDF
jgi:hypothetical protein